MPIRVNTIQYSSGKRVQKDLEEIELLKQKINYNLLNFFFFFGIEKNKRKQKTTLQALEETKQEGFAKMKKSRHEDLGEIPS